VTRSELALAVAVALLAAPAVAASAAPRSGAEPAPGRGWVAADPAHRWSFPRDHHAHPDHRNEWWYFTGLLEAEDGRRFGYQLTFFRVGLVPDPAPLDSAFAAAGAVMGHAAVTDVQAGTHAFSEILWRAAPMLGGFGAPGDAILASALAPPGTAGRWTIRLDADGFALAMRDDAAGIALDLRVRPARPVVLQGPNGYSRKAAAEGYASLYYSYTRLATEGTLTTGGRTFRVRGTSWMDKEFGSSQLGPAQVGWDWWSLRLSDGRDLMLYALRRGDGTADWRNGTLVEKDGSVRLLAAEEWTAEATGSWRSGRTGATYPSGWRVRVPRAGVDVTVEPEVREAENVSRLVPGIGYWEGPVRVRAANGTAAGEGYAELTGYAKGGRLPL
jgi:predicted secreted hydrolase